MVLSSGIALPQWVVRKQIALALDLIVQNVQLPDGSRKITHITEVIDDLENDEVVLKDIFRFDIEGVDDRGNVEGRWKTTGVIPSFYPTFKRLGLKISEKIFKAN
jgi:pilus assembly protein CpaF